MNVIQKILGHSKLETTVKFYIGAADNNMAKKLMQDEHFRIIPPEVIYKSTSQNPNIGYAPSAPVPYQPQGSICKLYPGAHGQESPSHAQSGSH